ncbi:LexA family protein [Algiphilus sp.]|uniref:LexA family protein n=1 Tax=Algiphilus sp. TaxID=1872431 RepID=UPI003B5283DB
MSDLHPAAALPAIALAPWPPVPLPRRVLPNIVEIFRAAPGRDPVALPYVHSPPPQAGFPSPAADYVEDALDLHTLMVRNPPATFYVRVRGESMKDAGIHDQDILVVDRSLDPAPGRIVVAVVDGDFYVKRLTRLASGVMALASENEQEVDRYPDIRLDRGQDVTIWGVVTGAIRRF